MSVFAYMPMYKGFNSRDIFHCVEYVSILVFLYRKSWILDRELALKCLFLEFPQRYSRKMFELQYRLNKILSWLQDDGEGYVSY